MDGDSWLRLDKAEMGSASCALPILRSPPPTWFGVVVVVVVGRVSASQAVGPKTAQFNAVGKNFDFAGGGEHSPELCP